MEVGVRNLSEYIQNFHKFLCFHQCFFNVYIVAITSQQLDGQGRTLAFVDDILLYRQARDRNEIISCMQKEISCSSSWCDNAKAIVHPSKAAETWFSVNNHIIKTDMPAVELCDVVARTSLLMYLGVKFDHSLCFKEHVDCDNKSL